MQADDRKAFEAILAEMFGAIDKPLSDAAREAFWKGLQPMTLIEFSRCHALLLEDLQGGERPRTFGVPNVWALKGRLRAAAPTKFPDSGWRGDAWDERANLRLYAHILRAWQTSNRHFSETETRLLVALKNRWAETMRASGGFEAVPMEDQDHSWTECIRQAEAEMARDRAA